MKYGCPLCGHIYDGDGEGVPLADLPDDWICPKCGDPKSELCPAERIGRETAYLQYQDHSRERCSSRYYFKYFRISNHFH